MYLFVQYGQNLLDFNSDLIKDFYFIGMACVNVLISFVLFKLYKNIATSLYLFICLGALSNEIFFKGGLNYMDVSFGILGVVYILSEKVIKKIIKKWMK